MRVTKRIEARVTPAAPSPGGVLQLSLNDQILPPDYVSFLFFFKEKPLPDPFALLKASLAQALTVFYPCAGRFRESVNGELEVVCSDEGAVLHEAWVDCSYDDFLPNFDVHPDFQQLVPAVEPSASIANMPIFLAQITHFECGRICVGTRHHHNLCDGLAMSHFVRSWATLTNWNVKASNIELKDLGPCVQPHFDRSPLKPTSSPSQTFNHPEYQPQPIDLSLYERCMSKMFSFTPSHIDALRARARPGLITPTYTRFETLAAHLWRGISLSRGLGPHQNIMLSMVVDGRKRFDPPLRDGYFGNVLFYAYIEIMAGKLVENSLTFAADRVKETIAKVTDKHMRSATDWVSKQESPKLVSVSFLKPFVSVVISSWVRFPLYDVNFGWGKPSFVRTPMSFSDGVILFLPSPLGEGHVDALVSLCNEHTTKLEEYIKDAMKAC